MTAAVEARMRAIVDSRSGIPESPLQSALCIAQRTLPEGYQYLPFSETLIAFQLWFAMAVNSPIVSGHVFLAANVPARPFSSSVLH